uniref:Uncharacterized protein n=1 Tax=Chromera velia CCMP2878 TaxID=1169474 RepID=A0A0G4HTL9_9ALVE|eukprot:Cvel_1360.t1-p1 / transcript=Cvel_1360.t1 / gene=Cvel_1360 / organism=Chromera_velia_CCMP2878 / gene_product=hypothetical protein / transcript_product=hypothetical protein / location=Cvel_scaffold46:157218-162764(+) / protein_length=502 / sequence_SO=supercontig / SO=protein_coding / is_pseudo=false
MNQNSISRNILRQVLSEHELRDLGLDRRFQPPEIPDPLPILHYSVSALFLTAGHLIFWSLVSYAAFSYWGWFRPGGDSVEPAPLLIVLAVVFHGILMIAEIGIALLLSHFDSSPDILWDIFGAILGFLGRVACFSDALFMLVAIRLFPASFGLVVGPLVSFFLLSTVLIQTRVVIAMLGRATPENLGDHWGIDSPEECHRCRWPTGPLTPCLQGPGGGRLTHVVRARLVVVCGLTAVVLRNGWARGLRCMRWVTDQVRGLFVTARGGRRRASRRGLVVIGEGADIGTAMVPMSGSVDMEGGKDWADSMGADRDRLMSKGNEDSDVVSEGDGGGDGSQCPSSTRICPSTDTETELGTVRGHGGGASFHQTDRSDAVSVSTSVDPPLTPSSGSRPLMTSATAAAAGGGGGSVVYEPVEVRVQQDATGVQLARLADAAFALDFLMLCNVLKRKYLAQERLERHEFQASVLAGSRCFLEDILQSVFKVFVLVGNGFSQFLVFTLIM